MPRTRRAIPAGHVYHVLNRACDRRLLFRNPEEYQSFTGLLEQGRRRVPMRICAYCIMPNHWHLLLWPEEEGAVSAYLHWVTTVHSLQFREASGNVGSGHVYQNRFHCFPVESAAYYFQVTRYIEANALRAGLVRRAEDWRWSSASEHARQSGLTTRGPSPLPENWLEFVNSAPAAKEMEVLRASTGADRPYGSPEWVRIVAEEQGLSHKLRPRGRPRLSSAGEESAL